MSFSGVEERGNVDVEVKDVDAALAVAVCKDIDKILIQKGLAQVGPSDRPVKSARGAGHFVYDEDGKLLVHDLVLQQNTRKTGLWSTEVRCANVYALAGLQAARKRCRKECEKFWELMQAAGCDSRWAGRMLILVWLNDDRKHFSVRADVFTPLDGWRGLFGWSGATAVIAPTVAIAPQRVAVAAKAVAAPRGRPGRLPQKRPWSELSSSLFPPDNHELYALTPRSKVARVLDVLKGAGRENKHCKEKLESWFPDGCVGFREGRDYGKGPSSAHGGRETWVANLAACKKIHELC